MKDEIDALTTYDLATVNSNENKFWEDLRAKCLLPDSHIRSQYVDIEGEWHDIQSPLCIVMNRMLILLLLIMMLTNRVIRRRKSNGDTRPFLYTFNHLNSHINSNLSN